MRHSLPATRKSARGEGNKKNARKTPMVKMTIGVAAFWLASSFASAAIAQDYPTRPVTMVVPFAAGGPIDVLGRMRAPALGEALGQPVVIENMSGGGGLPGAYRVSQAPPDGYQFVLGSIGTPTLSPPWSKTR